MEANEGVLIQLERHGYARGAVLRYLAAAEPNAAAAAYCLLAEAAAEAARPAAPLPAHSFCSVAGHGGGGARAVPRHSASGTQQEQQRSPAAPTAVVTAA